jgi:hypothetical protein
MRNTKIIGFINATVVLQGLLLSLQAKFKDCRVCGTDYMLWNMSVLQKNVVLILAMACD